MSDSNKCASLLTMLLLLTSISEYNFEPINVNLKSLIESSPDLSQLLNSPKSVDLNSFIDNLNQFSLLANTLNANNINLNDLSNTVNTINSYLNNNNIAANNLANLISSLTQASSTLNANGVDLSSLSNALNTIGQLLTSNSNANSANVANYLNTINQLMTYLNLKPADFSNVISSMNFLGQLYQSLDPMNVTNVLVLLQNKQIFDQVLHLGNLDNIVNKTALEGLINQIASIAAMNETMLEQTFSVDNVLTFLNVTIYKGTFLQLLSQMDNLTSIVNDLNDNLNNLTALMTGFSQYGNISGVDFMSGLLDMNTNVRNCIANVISDQTSKGSAIIEPCTLFMDQNAYTALLNYLGKGNLNIQTIINNQVTWLNKASGFLNDTSAIMSKVDMNDLTSRIENSLIKYLGIFVKGSLIQPNETLPTLPPATVQPISTSTSKNASSQQMFSSLTVFLSTLLSAFMFRKFF